MRMQASTQTLPIASRCSGVMPGAVLPRPLSGGGAASSSRVRPDGCVALAVGEYLDFHVARILQELLHVDLLVAERGLGLGLGHGDGIAQVRLGTHHAHAAAAAAAGGLDDHRVTDLACNLQVGVDVLAKRAAGARHARHAGGLHCADRLDLVAHQADHLGGRADEDETGLLDLLGEVGALGQKTVARMDRLSVGDLGRRDDAGDVEVAVDRWAGTDADRLVGQADMLQIAIHSGVHRHGLDAQTVAGA
jgi:hypothetical protein